MAWSGGLLGGALQRGKVLLAVVLAGVGVFGAVWSYRQLQPTPQGPSVPKKKENTLLVGVRDNRDADFRPRVVFPRPFPPITKLRITPAQEAQKLLRPDELVLGVVVKDQARAYPINALTGPRREVFNDTLAGRPIAATW